MLEQIRPGAGNFRCITRKRADCGHSTFWIGWTSWAAATRSWSPTWSAPDVGGSVPAHHAQSSLAVVRRRRDHGIRFPGGHWRQAGPARAAGVGRRGRRGFQMTLSELATARSQAGGQGHHHEQPLPGHGSPVAGTVLRQSTVGIDLDGNPDFVKLAEAYGPRACTCAGLLTWTACSGPLWNTTTALPDRRRSGEGRQRVPHGSAGASLREMIIDPPRVEADETGEPS